LQEGQPRLVSIRNEEQTEHEAGVVEYAMLCPSGGAMDLYIQPFLPQPPLLILGVSPVARELSHLASRFDFAVAAVDGGDTPPGDLSQVHIPAGAFVVVATMGSDDEAALALAAASEAAYVGFVASRKKMSVLADHLREQGVPAEQLERIKAPAGLDIKAATPTEIALSVLAEIVLLRRSGTVESKADSGVAQAAEALVAFEAREAQDPVCGMMVDISSARHVFQHNGHTYYFCCEHCQRTFEKEPAKFVGEELS
jgi:xanthine dehydrogenase accessory factor